MFRQPISRLHEFAETAFLTVAEGADIVNRFFEPDPYCTMALNTIQQILQLVSEAERVLICLPREARIDDTLAGVALASVLNSNGTKTTLVSESFVEHSELAFLGIEGGLVRSALPPLHQFTVSLDVSRAPLDSLRYRVTEDKQLEIFLTPTSGTYSKDNLSIRDSVAEYGLIVTIGSTDYASLGNYHKDAADFITSTPLINIDHAPENERYGTINVVNTTAAANCEVVYHLIDQLGITPTDPQFIARCLLTGILSKTSGLRHASITPHLITVTQHLMEQGADMAHINTQLFHTAPLSQFKLWGRVLARLQEDRKHNIVWSSVPYEDFAKTQTTDKELIPIVRDLISGYGHAEIVVLLWEQHDHSLAGIIVTNLKHNALTLAANFTPEGRRDFARFTLSAQRLGDAQKLVLDSIHKKLEHTAN